MAIGESSTIEFYGTLDDLDSASAAVSNNTFSVAGDLAAWTNDDDAPIATVVGLFTFGTAPTGGATIDLYARLLNIADTTKDAPVPTTDQPVVYLGAYILDNVTSEQVIAIDVVLPNAKTSQEYEFYIYNNGTGQSLSSGWSLQITPKTYGPHPA